MEACECTRCGGEGRLAEHSNVQNGVCFKCWGTGLQQNKPRVRKPNKKKEEARKAKRAAAEKEWERKYQLALELYAGDERLTVGPEHAYYYMHIVNLAKCDEKWDTL